MAAAFAKPAVRARAMRDRCRRLHRSVADGPAVTVAATGVRTAMSPVCTAPTARTARKASPQGAPIMVWQIDRDPPGGPQLQRNLARGRN